MATHIVLALQADPTCSLEACHVFETQALAHLRGRSKRRLDCLVYFLADVVSQVLCSGRGGRCWRLGCICV